MRRSTARLARSQVLLAELEFPLVEVHIHRTRLPFIHLDNLLDYAKIDRDGQVDGYITVYLPDELTVLFMEGGELRTAVGYQEGGRVVLPISTALRHIRDHMERGELAFATAPLEQLAWMYQSCAEPATARFVDAGQPEQLLPALRHEVFSGVLELIVNGNVSYLQFEVGEFVHGYFTNMRDGENVEEFVQRNLDPDPEGRLPRVSAKVFKHTTSVPEQASSKFVETYRTVFWGLVDRADAVASGGARKQAIKYRDLVKTMYPSLEAIGQPLDQDPVSVVATPKQLTAALSEWARQFLEQIEIVAPGVAAETLAGATKDHRFVLQKHGFFDGLPWKVSW